MARHGTINQKEKKRNKKRKNKKTTKKDKRKTKKTKCLLDNHAEVGR
jgi:hypothetical protein